MGCQIENGGSLKYRLTFECFTSVVVKQVLNFPVITKQTETKQT